MKNKKRVFRIAVLLLVLCMISTVMISGTFAKYTSVYAGQDTALVAKWDLTMTDGATEFNIEPPIATLNLFSHAYDVNITQSDGHYIIAPGVDGSFNLNLTNNSDVAAEISFDITDSNPADAGSDTYIPIVFSLEDNFETVFNNVTELENKLNNFNGDSKLIKLDIADPDGNNDNFTNTVYWKWDFEAGRDTKDTKLGTTSSVTENRTEYILTIKVTASQVAPSED